MPNVLGSSGELNQPVANPYASQYGVRPFRLDRALLNCQTEMLLNGSNPLLQPFHTFLNLAIREVDECACFSELPFKEGLILSMTPVEMHLKSFGNQLEFVAEPFR